MEENEAHKKAVAQEKDKPKPIVPNFDCDKSRWNKTDDCSRRQTLGELCWEAK